jgi:hypothetical protein
MIPDGSVAAERCEGDGVVDVRVDSHTRSKRSAMARCGAGKGVAEVRLAWCMGSSGIRCG